MIKYQYTVLKPFSLTNDEDTDDVRLAVNDDEKKHGSSFDKGAKYVDYKISSEDLSQNDITQELLKKRYIKLEKEKEVDR